MIIHRSEIQAKDTTSISVGRFKPGFQNTGIEYLWSGHPACQNIGETQLGTRPEFCKCCPNILTIIQNCHLLIGFSKSVPLPEAAIDSFLHRVVQIFPLHTNGLVRLLLLHSPGQHTVLALIETLQHFVTRSFHFNIPLTTIGERKFLNKLCVSRHNHKRCVEAAYPIICSCVAISKWHW